MKRLFCLILIVILTCSCALAEKRTAEQAVLEAADTMWMLASDKNILNLYVPYMSAQYTEIADLYAENLCAKPSKTVRLLNKGPMTDLAYFAIAKAAGYSETAQKLYAKNMFSAATFTNIINARKGMEAVAVSSMLTYTDVSSDDIPSSLYCVYYENGTGALVGFWNNDGANLITAAPVVDTTLLTVDGIIDLFKSAF